MRFLLILLRVPTLFDFVSECVCNSNGTDPGFLDTCNYKTGQCRCLPNVIGTQCDKCADGFWNLASGVGCQKCDCCGEGSTQATCNEVMRQKQFSELGSVVRSRAKKTQDEREI